MPGRPFNKPKPKGQEMTAEEAELEDIRRARIPKDNEVLAVLERRLGGSRVEARCFDGKTRVCRIPGRLKRKLWVREGDIILIEPWEHGGDSKGDVIFKYKPNQVKFLESKGLLSNINGFDEF